MFNYQNKILKNGLEVIAVPMPALNSITALMLVNTGSRFEDKQFYGAAHLLEHLVFKGTKNYPDSQQLSIALDEIGANSNAFTSKESTGYYVNAASSHLPLSLKILKELVFHPLLRDQDVKQEKLVVAEEIKMYLDSPEDFVADEFEQMVFKNTGLAHPISGNLADVSGLTVSKLRLFLNDWYGVNNMVLVIAGDAQVVQAKNFFADVEAIFSQQPEGRKKEHAQHRKALLCKNPVSTVKQLKFDHKTAQTHLVLGWSALKRNDPQRYVLTVLSTVLGGNRSSRLFNVVREQSSLAYYIYSDISQYHDGGLLGASAGINSQRTEEGIALIINEFEKLADGREPVTTEELKRSQDYLAGKILLGLENSRSVAQQYGMAKLLLGRVEEPDEIIRQLNQVTIEQIQQLAEQIIKKDEVRIALVS